MALPISKFEYYDGSWNEETSIIGLEYRDPIDYPRQLTVKISDPWNDRQETVGYKEMHFVRLTERLTEEILFFGRIQFVNPRYDESLGQILEIECFDMSMELLEQVCNVDYTDDLGSGAVAISDVIEEIIDDFVYGGLTGNIRPTKIETSTTNISGAPSFESKRTAALKAINMLANEDERTPASGKYGWVFRVNNGTQIAGNVAEGVYYYRGKYCGSKCSDESLDTSSGDAETNGMTIAFNETETDQKKPMIGGYNFPTNPKEIFTEVHVPYVEDSKYYDFSKKVPDGGGDLEDTIGYKRHKYLSGTGAKDATEAEEIADAWIAQYEQTNAPQKGEVHVNGYPVYTKSGVDYFLTAGSLVHINLQRDGTPILTSIHDTDMLVTEITYNEPEFTSTISLVEKDYGYDGRTHDLTNKFLEMVDTSDNIVEIANTYDSDGIPVGVLHKAVQPHICKLTFNIKGEGAPNNDIVQWQDGTIGDGYAIVFTDGDKFWISDGEIALATTISYLYADISGKVDGDQVTISQTSDYAVAIGTDHVLLAVCEQAPTSDEQALVLPSNGKHPLINAIVMTANMIKAEHLESQLVLTTELICGTVGGARIQMDSGGVQCYYGATSKYFELIASTGKARCYDGGMEFYYGATKVATQYTFESPNTRFRIMTESGYDISLYSQGADLLFSADDKFYVRSGSSSANDAMYFLCDNSSGGMYFVFGSSGKFRVYQDGTYRIVVDGDIYIHSDQHIYLETGSTSHYTYTNRLSSYNSDLTIRAPGGYDVNFECDDIDVSDAAEMYSSDAFTIRTGSGQLTVRAGGANLLLRAGIDVVFQCPGSTYHVRPDTDDYYILGGNSDWRWKQINGFDIVDHSPTFPILEEGYLKAISEIQVDMRPHKVNKKRNKVVSSSLPKFCRPEPDINSDEEFGEGTSLGNFTALAIGAINELESRVQELENWLRMVTKTRKKKGDE